MFPIARFRVEDRSMEPAFHPGDYVLVNLWAYRVRRPSEGDIVVASDPQHPSRFLVKRISSVTDTEACVLLGDNAASSRDSRHFGAVEKERIVGKVWLRLKP